MQVIVLTYIIINSKIQHFNMVLDVELAKTIIARFSIDLDDLQNSNPTTGNNCGGLHHYDLQMLGVNYPPHHA